MTDPSLAVVVAEAAAGVGGIDSRTGSDGWHEFLIGDRSFAALAPIGEAASFRLLRAVADAALRTPDTEPSARGPEWVTLRPITIDDHARDRAVAWFESACRHARD